MGLKPLAIVFWDASKCRIAIERIAYRPYSEGYKIPLDEIWERVGYACRKLALSEKKKAASLKM